MMSAIRWYNHSVREKLARTGEDAVVRSASGSGVNRSTTRLPGGLSAIFVNLPGAMFVAAAPAGLRKIPVDQGLEDASTTAEISESLLDQRSGLRAIGRRSNRVSSSHEIPKALKATAQEARYQSPEQSSLEKPTILDSLASTPRQPLKTPRSYTSTDNTGDVMTGGTARRDDSIGVRFVTPRVNRFPLTWLATSTPTQPVTTAAVNRASPGGSKSLLMPPLNAVARGNYPEHTKFAPVAVGIGDPADLSITKAGSSRNDVLSKATERSMSNNINPVSLTSSALNVVPRGVAAAKLREASSFVSASARSGLMPASESWTRSTGPSGQPGTPFSQRVPMAAQQGGSVVALRGDVLMDGRKMGRLVAAGHTSVAGLPSISSSAVNLKAVPVFAGTSVPL